LEMDRPRTPGRLRRRQGCSSNCGCPRPTPRQARRETQGGWCQHGRCVCVATTQYRRPGEGSSTDHHEPERKLFRVASIWDWFCLRRAKACNKTAILHSFEASEAVWGLSVTLRQREQVSRKSEKKSAIYDPGNKPRTPRWLSLPQWADRSEIR